MNFLPCFQRPDPTRASTNWHVVSAGSSPICDDISLVLLFALCNLNDRERQRVIIANFFFIEIELDGLASISQSVSISIHSHRSCGGDCFLVCVLHCFTFSSVQSSLYFFPLLSSRGFAICPLFPLQLLIRIANLSQSCIRDTLYNDHRLNAQCALLVNDGHPPCAYLYSSSTIVSRVSCRDLKEMALWRSVGLSYVRYSQIAAQVTRRALKVGENRDWRSTCRVRRRPRPRNEAVARSKSPHGTAASR